VKKRKMVTPTGRPKAGAPPPDAFPESAKIIAAGIATARVNPRATARSPIARQTNIRTGGAGSGRESQIRRRLRSYFGLRRFYVILFAPGKERETSSTI
jgi:hypothetical protein